MPPYVLKGGGKSRIIEDTIWRDAEDSNKGGYLWVWVNGTDGRDKHIVRLFDMYLFILFDF